ncbi:hypothetical protein ABH942_001079 [Flavobacterium sp. 28YEA47A]|uniref:hypothetical protein n=1 Tax=Flavobacterium sp. 28YEA47A TaxID=3156276 RepID=UPI003514103A
MKKINFLINLSLLAFAASSSYAQQVTGSSLFSPSGGGARILSAQGNTAANPAIGFQSTVSTTTTAQNDGGGGNGIFRPAANSMAFSTASIERMRIAPGGSIGIGTTNPLHKFHLHDGLMMISGANGSGGPMIVFSDNIANNAYPNGRWGIEYVPNKGLNFWKPFNPSTGGGGNYYMLLKDDGRVSIGTENTPTTIGATDISAYRLYVKGGILTDELRVATGWADYVFEDNYNLKPLSEVESFIEAHGHLPNVPSAKQVESEGISVGEMAKIQQEKIEELTLYIIMLNKKLEVLEAKLNQK